jgi:hypothetical protein
MSHEPDPAVHAGPVEPDEGVQHGGVALVRGGHSQREDALGDEADETREGSEHREMAANEHDSPG